MIERHSEVARQRGGGDARSPQYGPRGEALVPDIHLAIVEAIDDCVGAHLDAEVAQRSFGRRRKPGWNSRGPPPPKRKRARRSSRWWNSLWGGAAGEVGQGACKLDPGGSGADEDEVVKLALRMRIRLAIGKLEREEHTAPDLESILERLQIWRVLRVFVVAEIGLTAARGKDQVIGRRRARVRVHTAAAAQPNAPRLWIDRLHDAENHVDVALASKEGSQRLGNVTAVSEPVATW